MKQLNVGFVDFEVNWGPWPNPVEYFTSVLSLGYDVRVVVSDFRGQIVPKMGTPDLVIGAMPCGKHREYDCPRVFFPAEYQYPGRYEEYAGSMTCHYDPHPNHYRLPLYALYGNFDTLTQPRVQTGPRKFCCVLFGKDAPHSPREEFFRRLSQYKRVDSAGHYLNNMGITVAGGQGGPAKIEFCRQYKFVLAFENAEAPGWTTEKLVDPMFASSVALYWGNPMVSRDFNTRSFVNAYDYRGMEEMIEGIIKLDNDDAAYRRMLAEPCFNNNVVNEFIRKENILKFFKRVLNDA